MQSAFKQLTEREQERQQLAYQEYLRKLNDEEDLEKE